MSNKLIDLSALSEYKDYSDLKYQDKLTAGDGITISNNTISATPYIDLTALSGYQTVSNNTIVNLGNITLMPGYYMISFVCTFAANSSGYRQCGFSLNTTDITGFGRDWGDNRASATGEDTVTCVSGSLSVSSSSYPNGQKFYFLAKQNSGSSLRVYPRFSYFKF